MEKVLNRRARECYSSKSSMHDSKNLGGVWKFGIDKMEDWFTEPSFNNHREWQKDRYSKYHFEKLKPD